MLLPSAIMKIFLIRSWLLNGKQLLKPTSGALHLCCFYSRFASTVTKILLLNRCISIPNTLFTMFEGKVVMFTFPLLILVGEIFNVLSV